MLMRVLNGFGRFYQIVVETACALLLQVWPVIMVLLAALFFLVYTEQGIDVLAGARGDAGEVFQLLVAIFILAAASGLCIAHLLMLPPDWDRRIAQGLSTDQRAGRKWFVGGAAVVGPLMLLMIVVEHIVIVEFDVWRYYKANAIPIVTFLGLLAVTITAIVMALRRDALSRVIRIAGWGAMLALLAFAAFPVTLGTAIGAEFTLFLMLTCWLFVACQMVAHARVEDQHYVLAAGVGAALVVVIVGWPGDSLPARPIRCVDGTCEPAQQTRTLPAVFSGWRTQHGENQRPVLLMVAAAGGGARASYWTSIVLGRVTDDVPDAVRRHLFVASGVSGGALGLAVHRGLLASEKPACAEGERFFEACARRFGQGDFLAPNIAALMTGDIVNQLLLGGPFTGRDVALELAWEERWKAVVGNTLLAEPFAALWPTAMQGPSLVLNATSTRNGERLVISDLAAATFPGGVTGCRTNLAEHARISISAAVNASARFPVIDPPGALAVRPCDGSGDGALVLETVADGGFHDNFGAATLLNVLDALHAVARVEERELADLVRLVVVQITSDPSRGFATGLDRQLGDDNLARIGPCTPRIAAAAQAPAPPAPPKRWWLWSWLLSSSDRQLVEIAEKQKALGATDPLKPAGPLGTLMKARERTGAAFPVELRRRVKALRGDYFHFAMDESVSAPLGWVMSRRAQRELDRLLDSPCHKAQVSDLVAILGQK
jgi:hypothetical protein